MNKPATRWTDQRVETIIGNLLRAGVLLAAAVVALGGVIFLVRHGCTMPQYARFVGEPFELRTVSGIVRRAASFRGRNIIQLGLLLLIATPVARVAFSVVAFALERDRLYVGVTLIVLAVLLFSLAGGHV
ncbi:MAG: DUF1634 domain-containing protein [Acidobacteriia bacterium]|nr:DUF1634 domain-containing protein [Terriglobia bacterium]